MPTPDHYKFIFLCGLHKSGTSPLFRILREHPQISGFSNTGVPEDEGQHLQSVFPPAKVYGGPGRFGFSAEAHLTEKSTLVNSANADRLFAEWSAYWDLHRPYLLEKSPPNLIRTRFLQAIFPNSYFVVISRHPVAVSLATQKWAGTSLESLIEHWLHCYDLFDRDRSHLERVLAVKYEDLIRTPQPELDRIWKFLGVAPLASAVLDPGGNERYFTAWQNLATDEKGRAVHRRSIEQYEKRVQSYGYSLADCGAVLPAPSSSH
jgi:hypothetical protein